ncbi:MAG: NlpC/P60 family protein [Sporichthyaceae bacterium]
MSHKHRRPSKISRISRQPLHLGVAAGVAGTVAVTGTLVASAAPAPTPASTQKLAPVSLTTSMSTLSEERTNRQALKQHIAAQRAAEARLAEAKNRKAAAARRAAAKKAAELRAAQARKKATASRSNNFGRTDERMSRSAAHVLAIAAAQQGDRYQYGANGPDSFDCSGFTQYVFSKVGISLPHSSGAQRSMATRVAVPRPGDLVFVYNGGGGSVGHVAIYAGNGYWYEASNPSRPVGKHRAWSSNVSYGRVL